MKFQMARAQKRSNQIYLPKFENQYLKTMRWDLELRRSNSLIDLIQSCPCGPWFILAQYTRHLWFSDLFRVLIKEDSFLSSQRAQRHAPSPGLRIIPIFLILHINLIIVASAGTGSGIKRGNPLVSMGPLFLNSLAMIKTFLVSLLAWAVRIENRNSCKYRLWVYLGRTEVRPKFTLVNFAYGFLLSRQK